MSLGIAETLPSSLDTTTLVRRLILVTIDRPTNHVVKIQFSNVPCAWCEAAISFKIFYPFLQHIGRACKDVYYSAVPSDV